MTTYKVYEKDRGDKVCRMTTTNRAEAEDHCLWLRCHYRRAWVEVVEA